MPDAPDLYEPEAAPEDPPPMVGPLPAAVTPTYVESVWSGLSNYICLHCGVSTLSFVHLTDHLRVAHQTVPMPAVQDAPVPLMGREDAGDAWAGAAEDPAAPPPLAAQTEDAVPSEEEPL